MQHTILLSDIISIKDPQLYKLHLGGRNEEGCHPLDEFIVDPKSWKGWNESRSKRDQWTRQFIFSLIEFYPKVNSWLFGGIFKVIDRHADHYDLDECADYTKYVGRLILSFYRYKGLRGRAFNFENHVNSFAVTELLPEVYQGEIFPGYDSVSHDFSILEPIVRKEKTDWKVALQNVKGVYVVTDKSNGKSYVGSAYADSGIWSRLQCYVGTGHGWNDQLMTLISNKGIEYARSNFRFSILEILSMSSSDEYVISRENRWKSILMTREHGYNSN